MTYGKFIDDQKFKIEWTFDGIEHSIDFIVTNNRAMMVVGLQHC